MVLHPSLLGHSGHLKSFLFKNACSPQNAFSLIPMDRLTQWGIGREPSFLFLSCSVKCFSSCRLARLIVCSLPVHGCDVVMARSNVSILDHPSAHIYLAIMLAEAACPNAAVRLPKTWGINARSPTSITHLEFPCKWLDPSVILSL